MKSKTVRNRKAQASLEYLMTYGWAILIMTMAVIVLWQMGAFTPPTAPPGCTGFSQLRPLDWKASSTDNNIYLTLLNDAGVKVRLDQVNVTVLNIKCSQININREIRAGESYPVNVTSCAFPDYGNFYRADIVIVYTNLASDLNHNSIGECHGNVE